MIVDGKASLRATPLVKKTRQSDKVKLVTSIFQPHLEQLPLDCGNCGFLGFKVVVSPLKGEHKTTAVVRKLVCVKCGRGHPVEDGMIAGENKTAVERIRRVVK
ncbi:MAG: hypothetical protein AAF942_00095 [Pseudomonadota bacterium]